MASSYQNLLGRTSFAKYYSWLNMYVCYHDNYILDQFVCFCMGRPLLLDCTIYIIIVIYILYVYKYN